MKRITIVAALLAGTVTASFVSAQEADPATPEVPTTTTAPVPVAPPEQTVPKQSVGDRLAFLLSGYEYFPTRADLDEVAKPEVIVATLIGFASDEDARTTLRLRAVDALGFYDTPAATEHLAALIETPLTDLPRKQLRVRSLLKHHAITSLARARKEAAVPQIVPILASQDVQLRLTVISALGKHGGAGGLAALAALRETEQSDLVKRELRKWVP